jgi:cytolysin-activating lysine-acyltransferase
MPAGAAAEAASAARLVAMDTKTASPTATSTASAKTERSPNETRATFLAMAEAAKKSRFAQVFANAIAVLMRDVNYRELRLKDLEHLLLPPVIAGQCAVAQAKSGKDGPLIPIAVALWARVSPAIDKKLSADLDKPVNLRPNDWVSGDNVWMIMLAGDQKALPGFLQELLAKDLKGKSVKIRTTAKDGTRSVRVLSTGKA